MIHEPLERARLALAWSVMGKTSDDLMIWHSQAHDRPEVQDMIGYRGSLNQRPVWEASQANIDYFHELFTLWEMEGDWLTERDSEIYTPDMLVAMLRIWRHVRAQEKMDTVQGRTIKRDLRRTWAQFAIRSLQGDIDTLYYNDNEPRYHIRNRYPVVTVLAGDRNNFAHTQKLVGLILAWAINLPRHWPFFKPLIKLKPDIPKFPADDWNIRKPWHFTLSIMGGVMGHSHYDEAYGSLWFGLSENDRKALRGVILGTEPPKAIDHMLNGWRVNKRYSRVKIIRTTRGKPGVHSIMVAEEAAGNRNKPSNVSSSFSESGVYCLMRPSKFKAVGATLPDIKFTDKSVLASADGNKFEMKWLHRMPGNALLYIVEIDENGYHIFDPINDSDEKEVKEKNWIKRAFEKIRNTFLPA
jgi:hypothetical protein